MDDLLPLGPPVGQDRADGRQVGGEIGEAGPLLAGEVGEVADDAVDAGDGGIECTLLGQQCLRHGGAVAEHRDDGLVLLRQRGDRGVEGPDELVELVGLAGHGGPGLGQLVEERLDGHPVVAHDDRELVEHPAEGLAVELLGHPGRLVEHVGDLGRHDGAVEGDHVAGRQPLALAGPHAGELDVALADQGPQAEDGFGVGADGDVVDAQLDEDAVGPDVDVGDLADLDAVGEDPGLLVEPDGSLELSHDHGALGCEGVVDLDPERDAGEAGGAEREGQEDDGRDAATGQGRAGLGHP